MEEARRSLETSVFYHITVRRQNPEDRDMNKSFVHKLNNASKCR